MPQEVGTRAAGDEPQELKPRQLALPSREGLGAPFTKVALLAQPPAAPAGPSLPPAASVLPPRCAPRFASGTRRPDFGFGGWSRTVEHDSCLQIQNAYCKVICMIRRNPAPVSRSHRAYSSPIYICAAFRVTGLGDFCICRTIELIKP
jgi:hypothetical protein